jgi:dienelactone hydrolase
MSSTASPTLVVEPAVALIDVPRAIRLEHFAPHQAVEVEASLTRADGTVWRSRASFVTDARGGVDLAQAAPTSGSYQGPSASGLLWSLALQSGVEAPRGDEAIEPRVIALSAQGADGAQAAASLVQRLVAEGVRREEVRAEGLVGTLFRPAGSGPLPVVVVLNGSGGGINEARAALYAAHGYVAHALGYFRAPGLPEHISSTPLEYFVKALAWVRRELAPAHDFVALSGQSRGAELSLLLAATFGAAVSAVIAYVPSSVLHGTLRAGRPGEHPASPAWTHKGLPLPTVWDDNRSADWSAFNSTVSPVRQAPSFVSALLDADAVKRALIPVERIDAPVLLLSGTDDGFWPSSAMSDAIAQRLRQAGHAQPVEHLRYAGAGHSIQFPFVPTTHIVKPHAVAKVDLTAGGTPAANAHANQDSWPKVLEFLEQAVAARASQAQAG